MRWLLLLLLGVVFAAASDLKLQLDADQPVTVTLADGTTRELTAAEFEELAKERAEEQNHLQNGAGDADTARFEHQGIDEIKEKDPQLALHIDLARRAFKEIQRHGYAQGYALSGFSEQDTKQQATEYYVELVLRAKKDPNSGKPAKTGTGTRKLEKEGEEVPLSYEVQLLLDAQKRFSVIAAWELSDQEPPRGQQRKRVMRLSIQPTAALLDRETKREQTKPAVATWLLAGGMAMIAAGVLVMYNTRNPIPKPKPRRRSSDIWELVDENDKPIKSDTADKGDKKND